VKTIESGKPIFAFARKDFLEVIIHGCTAVKYQGKTLDSEFEDMYFVTRSLLKPWQMLAISEFDRRDFWAMGLSSHSGQSPHLETLRSFMEFLQASENDLMCPRSFPMDQTIAAQMREQQLPASRILHPCAGKHLTMIAACKAMGVDPDHYWNEDHQVQEKIFSFVAKEANEKLYWVTDSCGVPNAAMTVRAHLTMWEKLAVSKDERVKVLRDLWLQNFRLTGGRNRLDSDLIELGKGKLLAKEGADGLLVVQSLPDDSFPAVGMFVKLLSGYNSSFLAIALYRLILQSRDLPPVFQDIKQYLESRLDDWVPRDQTLKILP